MLPQRAADARAFSAAPAAAAASASAASASSNPAPASVPPAGDSKDKADDGEEKERRARWNAEKNAEKKKEDEPVTSWGVYFLYATGWVSGLTFFYHFYKEDYSLHRTEIAFVNAIRTLPLYYPPVKSVAYANGTVDGEGLSPELVLAFSEWFVSVDMQQTEGVIRDDVLELFREMGFDEFSKPCKRYLERGEGHLEERKRMSGTGLQESLNLLIDLVFNAKPEKLKEGEEPPPDPRTLVGPETVEMLRKKVRGVASVSAGASAMQAAMQAQHAPQPMAPVETMPAIFSPVQQDAPKPIAPLHSLSKDDDDDVDDTAEQLQIEASRLRRLEAGLMQRLENCGSLSSAEEARLRDVRAQQASLSSRA